MPKRKRKQYSDKPVDKTIDNLLFAQLYYSFFLEKPNAATAPSCCPRLSSHWAHESKWA